MSEPLLPVPPPEPDGHWDPLPPRCPECGEILDHRGYGKYRCQSHGEVTPVYGRKQ